MKKTIYPGPVCSLPPGRGQIFGKLTAWLMLLCLSFSSIAQNPFRVKGTVTAENGKGLPGASVVLKGTTTGATTDADGKYTLALPNGQGTLQISYIGYVSKEVAVGNQTQIDIRLDPSDTHLEEVVVVGYGVQKKATLTGSVSEVKGADIVKSPQPNVSNSLAGRFSGFVANNRAGEPGYDGSSYTIRGFATTGNNDVLVVVDGIPGQVGGLERLDPNDIESISVLKDASAAVYGSRAANGVILVTTRRGTTGKPVISYSFNQGFSSPTRLPKMADAPTYATILNEIDYYNNPNGGMNQHYSAEQIEKFRNGSDPINYPNTNWQKESLKPVALQNQQNLAINGGTENVKYYASLGTLYQDGLYRNSATTYRQYNFRSNIDANITKDFKVSLGLSGRQENRNFPVSSAGNNFRSIYRAYPTVIARYPNGYYSTGVENNNPAVLGTDMGGTTSNPTSIFNGILRANYALPFVEGLSVDGFYSVDKSFNFSKSFAIPYRLYNYDSATGTYNAVVTGGSAGAASLSQSQTNVTNITQNFRVSFLRQIGKHNVNTFVSYEQNRRNEISFGASRINFPTPSTPELSQGGAAATDKNNSGSSYNFTRRSVIGRLAYSYEDKYLAEVQARLDGSSIFPKGKQYGFFPSVSAGYRISEENWFKESVRFIDDLKFRASYGMLGNDNVGQFQFYNNYSFNNQYVLGSNVITPGIDLTKLANPNITWETSRKLDIGLNASFLKHFTLEVIYFQQKRSDILASRNASIPNTSGIVNPYGSGTLVPDQNLGKVNNSGFETSLSYNHSGRFRYSISGNLTYAKSKIIFIDEAPGLLPHQRQTGGPLYTYLLYRSLGIFRSQADLDKYPHLSGARLGDLILEDYNKDGKITADDQVRTSYGNVPLLSYGLVLNAGYGAFDASAVFAGQGMVSQYVLPESGQVGNFYSSWADNRWSPTNPNGSYPRVDTRASSSINGGLYANNFWLNNASFLRLKNVEIGYTLPKSTLSRLKLQSVRVYASGFNLFTITKVKDYDPEGNSSSGQFYPQQRILNLGLNVKF
ncbi:SusC/RagA family TonB-linked outer membrane protein [Siphonobacter aquaeclarae]|uniref:TonB-linked outer membrane protein, SusC/RagA family n=1 Tax=Siphonobacter aquaeclarae TaxID=563176 RepID=A0A1G9Y657_9BACT|nr:TonB-dependent receptor [Siphonobacter aquaeclarae]SDN04041.1 TonB-linked outer membrane protein, SusC/RagA family [Siphonobacter aquaeclarae]